MSKSRRRPGLGRTGGQRDPTGRDGHRLGGQPLQSGYGLTGTRLMRDEDGRLVERNVNLGESPLGWLSRRKDPNGDPFLSPHHVDAGDRLRADFTKGQMTPMITQNWGAVPKGKMKSGASSALTLGEAAMAARRRFEKAVIAMGPGLADVTVRICCYLQGLEAAEKENGWSARSGKVVLKLALDRLAEHYGLKLAGTRNTKQRVWKA